MSPPPNVSRRAVGIGALVGALAALGAGAIYELPRLLRHRARGEYADLVNRLDDPEKAALVGRTMPERAPSKEDLAELRSALTNTALADVATADARENRLEEADGWILPTAVATLCALAAQAI
jgi:hypothetical protein